MSESTSTNKLNLDSDLNLLKHFKSPTFEEWKEQVEMDLKDAVYDKKMITKTYEGIDLKPIYIKEDLEKFNVADSMPGFENFSRGKNVDGYFKNTWNVNQEILTPDPGDFNVALIEALKNGQNCIKLSLDSATKKGKDADYAESEEVGDTGLSISETKSLELIFNSIDLEKYDLSVHAGCTLLPILSLVNSYFQLQNIPSEFIKGTISADPIFELATSGKLEYAEDFIFNSMKLSVEWAKTNSPNLKVIGINTLPFVNAGANSIQELGISISILNYYINGLIKKGISIEDIFNHTQFTFGICTNYFMEVAKFRAARILLYNIAKTYNAELQKISFNIGAEASKYHHTKLDPYVNLLRSTTQTFSAIIGGANNITTLPFDEVIGLPDYFSRRIARNTQTILREETHLDQVIDPAGGSYFIESLTEVLAKNSWEFFKKIEENGGILDSLKNNFIQTEIENISSERVKDLKKRKSVLVGTNMYANIKENSITKNEFNRNEFRQKRADQLNKFRSNRDSETQDKITQYLERISSSIDSQTIDLISKTYLYGATMGEITSSLIPSNNNVIEIQALTQNRLSEDFEKLRKMSSNYKAKNGILPTVFLANMGTVKDYKVRSDFSKGFFEVGGFEVLDPPGFTNLDNLINDVIDSETSIVVICSTDDKYPELVPMITKAIKTRNREIQIILAGYPKDQVEQYKKSGIDEFIYLGCDSYEILASLYKKLREKE